MQLAVLAGLLAYPLLFLTSLQISPCCRLELQRSRADPHLPAPYKAGSAPLCAPLSHAVERLCGLCTWRSVSTAAQGKWTSRFAADPRLLRHTHIHNYIHHHPLDPRLPPPPTAQATKLLLEEWVLRSAAISAHSRGLGLHCPPTPGERR